MSMPPSVHRLQKHPLRSLYLLYEALSTLLVRVPWWILISVRSRPRPSWSLKKTVFVRLVAYSQHVTEWTDSFRFVADHVTPSVGPDIKQVWIDPAAGDLLSDQLRTWMARGHVALVRIPGYWIDKKGLEDTPVGKTPSPSEKIGLFFHGGAYIRFSASPRDVIANIAKGILKHTPSVTRVLSVEYRLSKGAPDVPANAFPAALLDALASYTYLIRVVRVLPENIIVLGDSAGANLAHAVTRYLVENAGGVAGLPPPPGALLLLSPWVDLSNSHADAWSAKDDADYLGSPDSPMSTYARGAFLGAHGPDGALSRYISPASIHPRAEPASFVGFPRSMIIKGGAEALKASITTLAERMRHDLGERLTLYEAEDAVHDFIVFLLWEPERTDALKAIARWIEKGSGSGDLDGSSAKL